jgi:acyl-CoA synthetase (AMP-forming)/AMP-acid ligase II
LFGSVPTMLFDLAALPEEAGADFGSVRYVMTGGAPLTPRTRAEFERRFDLRICNVYGQTEAPMVVSADPLEGERPAGSVGRALPHVRLSIRDDQGTELPPGEVGEVCVGSAQPGSYEPMLGYLGRPEATAETLRDGVLHTGDVGYLDADGFLFLVDRLNDVIVRGGVNVYPAEVEAVLMRHDDVEECAVFGVPSERLGEVPAAAVVARPGSGLEPDRLARWLEELLAPYKRPVEIVLRDELPKNVMGKTLRRVLREEAAA